MFSVATDIRTDTIVSVCDAGYVKANYGTCNFSSLYDDLNFVAIVMKLYIILTGQDRNQAMQSYNLGLKCWKKFPRAPVQCWSRNSRPSIAFVHPTLNGGAGEISKTICPRSTLVSNVGKNSPAPPFNVGVEIRVHRLRLYIQH